ncbi:MAG: FUSC family protein [Gluconacetobacter diazotrophicus]|nr:FUSC family protein [Gluconacetobacter diazotrophicus]
MALAIRLRLPPPVPLRAALRLLPPLAWDSIRLGLTVVMAFFLAMELEFATPEWAGWTVLSVSLSTRSSSLQKSLWRVIGSVVGAAAAVATIAVFAQSALALDVAIAAWLGLAAALSSVERGQRSYGFALIGFTVPIVALGVVQQPGRVFPVALDRLSTILLGIACAHASSVLVARGTGQLGRELADAMERTAAACADWIERKDRPDAPDPGLPPVAAVLALDEAVFGAMVEQPSLRTGGRFLSRATLRLLFRLSAALAAPLLDGEDRVRRAGILLDLPGSASGEPYRRRRFAVVARLVREGRGIGGFYAPLRSLAIDRDWVQARNNAIRAMAATGGAEAFTYVTEWHSGSTAATWAAVVSTLFAARADAADAARDFLLGAALACLVAIPLHYTVLTASGNFGLLAAVLFPIAYAAAVGRAESGAVTAAGFGFLVFGTLSIHDRMTYDLGADLNGALAELVGMGMAVVAFRALPPPATPAERRRRAQRRMARDLRRIAALPLPLLPHPGDWTAPAFRRLFLVASDPSGPAERRDAGRTLLLAGLLVIALRREDDRLGRAAGRWFLFGEGAMPEPDAAATPEAAARLALLRQLRDEPGLTTWPGLPHNGGRP